MAISSARLSEDASRIACRALIFRLAAGSGFDEADACPPLSTGGASQFGNMANRDHTLSASTAVSIVAAHRP